MESSLLWVGRIVRTQGIKGQVRVLTSGGGGTETFKRGVPVCLKDDQGREKGRLTVDSSRVQRQFTILGFREIRRIEEAEGLVGASVFIFGENLSPLPPDEFYAYQLLGLTVRTDQGILLGTVQEIIPTGSNDVFVVRKNGEEILLPATDEVILRVDLREKMMMVRLLEGMRPEDDL